MTAWKLMGYIYIYIIVKSIYIKHWTFSSFSIFMSFKIGGLQQKQTHPAMIDVLLLGNTISQSTWEKKKDPFRSHNNILNFQSLINFNYLKQLNSAEKTSIIWIFKYVCPSKNKFLIFIKYVQISFFYKEYTVNKSYFLKYTD